jgi:hypothetical protein
MSQITPDSPEGWEGYRNYLRLLAQKLWQEVEAIRRRAAEKRAAASPARP